MALTERQRKFVHAYATNGQNGTQAAREAGYKGDDAQVAVTASKLLRVAKVSQALESLTGKAIAKAEKATIATLAECLQFNTMVMRSKVADFLDDSGELDVSKLRDAPAGLIRDVEVSSTTDEKGQVYARHKVKTESALAANGKLIDYYVGRKDAEQRERLLSDALQHLPPGMVTLVARLMLTGPRPIDVEARVLPQ